MDKLVKLKDDLEEDFAKKKGVPTQLPMEDAFEISLEGEPIKQNLRKYTEEQRRIIIEMIAILKEQGLIKQAKFNEVPSICNVVLLKKKDGKYRFAIDYRPLNKVTKSGPNTVPVIEQIFREHDPDDEFFVTKQKQCQECHNFLPVCLFIVK